MIDELAKAIQNFPIGFKNDLLETKKRSEVNLHNYLKTMFGEGYTGHFRKEQLVRPEEEINSIAAIAVNAGPLSHGALFCGIPGCGKTMTMLQVAHLIGHTILENYLANAFSDGSMMPPVVDDWFKARMKLFYMSQMDKDMVTSCKKNTSFIFLDDIVFVGLTDTKRQMLEGIIEACCRNNSIIFGTTNIHPDDLKELPEMQRVYSRLNLKCKFVIFKSQDFRLTQKLGEI
ncbi:MAG: AAA family ATPase [Caldisericia bacterium]|nr:AAA family ATPase [Caldisericia bacterium]